jgi:hypothetical protein
MSKAHEVKKETKKKALKSKKQKRLEKRMNKVDGHESYGQVHLV